MARRSTRLPYLVMTWRPRTMSASSPRMMGSLLSTSSSRLLLSKEQMDKLARTTAVAAPHGSKGITSGAEVGQLLTCAPTDLDPGTRLETVDDRSQVHTTWTGSRGVVVIPARPDGVPAPPDWVDDVSRRLFYDPAPNGDDCSVRAYIDTVSYGRAQLEPEVLGEVVVTMINDCAAMQDEALFTLPAGHSFERALVVFPPNTFGNACAGWAFGFGGPPFAGTSDLRAWGFASMDAPLGVWAMELLHMTTYFGDLYHPANPVGAAAPGRFDEMACSCATHPSAVTKMHMGWLNAADVPMIPRSPETRVTLHALGLRPPAPPGRIVAVRIPSLTHPPRYFLVECRLAVDRFERNTPGFSEGIPSEGVVVYEVDDVNQPFRMWLRTPTALAVGMRYTNDDEDLEVEVTASVWGGMKVTVSSAPAAEPAECGTLRTRIAELEAAHLALQDELANTVGGAAKARVRARMKEVENELRTAYARFRQLACTP
jgi:hypothetical protein